MTVTVFFLYVVASSILFYGDHFAQLDELFEGRDSNMHLYSPLVIHVNNKEKRIGSSL